MDVRSSLDSIAEVVGNGSDTPGTVLTDCSEESQRRLAQRECART